jgi:hypothetical protein
MRRTGVESKWRSLQEGRREEGRERGVHPEKCAWAGTAVSDRGLHGGGWK